jgi:hypothetical protein
MRCECVMMAAEREGTLPALYTLTRVLGVVRHCSLRRRMTSSTLDRLLDQRRRFGYTNTTVWYIAKLGAKSNSSCRSETVTTRIGCVLLCGQSLNSSE